MSENRLPDYLEHLHQARGGRAQFRRRNAQGSLP